MRRQTSAPIRTNGGSEPAKLADIRDSGLHFNRERPVRIDAQGNNARRRARLQLIVNRQRRVTLLAGHAPRHEPIRDGAGRLREL